MPDLAKILRAAMDRTGSAGRQSEELRGPTPATAPHTLAYGATQATTRNSPARRATIRGAVRPSRAASGSGTRLGPILGREPRKSDGTVLIAELRDRRAEDVTHSPHGANQRGTVGTIVKFLAESRDQRVDRAVEICPLAPAQHTEKGRARQWLAGVAQKRHQEVELRRRQVDSLPSGAHEVSRRLIEGPARECVESVDWLDGLRASNLELAPPTAPSIAASSGL